MPKTKFYYGPTWETLVAELGRPPHDGQVTLEPPTFDRSDPCWESSDLGPQFTLDWDQYFVDYGQYGFVDEVTAESSVEVTDVVDEVSDAETTVVLPVVRLTDDTTFTPVVGELTGPNETE